MRLAIYVLAAAVAAACARDESRSEARDVTETGAAEDVIGRPEGSDSIPPEMRGASDTAAPMPADSLRSVFGDSAEQQDSFKRPERRPVRRLPPLTRPDSEKP